MQTNDRKNINTMLEKFCVVWYVCVCSKKGSHFVFSQAFSAFSGKFFLLIHVAALSNSEFCVCVFACILVGL